jgi:hypothetical protein
MRGFFHLAIYTLLILSFSACQDDAGSLNLPDDLDKDYSLVFLDTVGLTTSTVILDSMPTSNSTVLLLGKYADDKLGVIESQPYMQFSLGESTWHPASTATFESMELIMKYNGYYYGDTTQTQNFQILQLQEDFKTYHVPEIWTQEFRYPTYAFVTSFLFSYPNQYNTSNFALNEVSPLGTFSLAPKPTITKIERDASNAETKQHLMIPVKLNDAVGEQWLAEAKNATGAFSTQNRFEDFFKGLAIKTDSPDGAVFGIQTDSSISNPNLRISIITIRIKYKEGNTSLKREFKMRLNSNNFNNIIADRTATPTENLASLKEIPSTTTGDETYIQSGTGIFTKIKIPGLKNILNLPGFLKINNARLVIEPVKDTYNAKTYLPSSLVLFETSNKNLPLQPLAADYSTKTQSASLQYDRIHNTVEGYTFSVTQYIQALLESETDNRNTGLLLSTPYEQLTRTVTRMVVGSKNSGDYRVRLEIYYLRRNE